MQNTWEQSFVFDNHSYCLLISRTSFFFFFFPKHSVLRLSSGPTPGGNDGSFPPSRIQSLTPFMCASENSLPCTLALFRGSRVDRQIRLFSTTQCCRSGAGESLNGILPSDSVRSQCPSMLLWGSVLLEVLLFGEAKTKVLTHYSCNRVHLPVSHLVELYRNFCLRTSYPSLPRENYCSHCQEGPGFWAIWNKMFLKQEWVIANTLWGLNP